MSRRFDAGESVVLREVWREHIWAARAATIVQDTGVQTIFFIPAGTTWMAAVGSGVGLRVAQEAFELAPRTYEEAHVLSFGWSDRAHAILLLFRPDWRPWSWYVNLQEPLRRTEIGFDTMDHELDAIVELDGTWSWKDEDEMVDAIERGVLPADAEPVLRAEGERAVRSILGRDPPLDRDWWSWRPDPRWPRPRLPAGWDRIGP